MIDMAVMTEFLGWCTAINFSMMLFSTLLTTGRLGEWTRTVHSNLFGINTDRLSLAYFRFLANYKLLVIVFNLVPYLALTFMQ